MITIWEVLDRVETGPYMEEKDFDIKVIAKKCRELVKEYDIKYNPEEIVTTDSSLADDLFEAGLRLFIDLGFYCQSTKRIIKFSEEEIKDELKNLPEKITIGQGKDSVIMKIRKVEEGYYPIVITVYKADVETFKPIKKIIEIDERCL
jgi:hypothetical protein